jgi:hypothetical protein
MKHNKLKLREWTREHGTTHLRDLPNLLQFQKSENKAESMNFFTRKPKLEYNGRNFSSGKGKMDFLGSSSDSSIKKLELELKMKTIEHNHGMKGRISSQKGSLFKSGNSLFSERASSARRRDDPMSIYFKSPTKPSRILLSEDKSGLNESRSLLARMKDEFRNSTNNSLSGIHYKDSKIHNISSENILIRSIMIKPKAPILEATLEEKQISLDNLKSEFYNKLSKQRKEMEKGGTLENLFSILSKEPRLSKDKKDNLCLISRSKNMDADRNSYNQDISREKFGSIKEIIPKDSLELRQLNDETIKFPTEKISELIKLLASLNQAHLSPSDQNQLILLRAQIKRLINS